MKKFRQFLVKFKSGFTLTLVLGVSACTQSHAYEPVVYQGSLYDNVSDHSRHIVYKGELKVPPVNYKDGYHGLSFNWQYYFNTPDCTKTAVAQPVFSVLFDDDDHYDGFGDTMGITAYTLSFVPNDGSFRMSVTLAPLVGGMEIRENTKYEIYFLDTFRNSDNPDYSFCHVNSVRKLDITLYANAYNSYIIVRTPTSPLGEVLEVPSRVGLGNAILVSVWTAQPTPPPGPSRPDLTRFSFQFAEDNKAKPSGSASSRMRINWLYWLRTNPVGESARNLTDDINLYYGARTYPLRSRVVDRTNAAAAMTELF